MKKMFLLLVLAAVAFADLIVPTPTEIALVFLIAFAITVAIETGILYLILHKEYATKQIIINSLIVNTITLPIVWFVFPSLGLSYPDQIGISEVFAFVAEAGMYLFLFKGIKLENATIASFVCNLASFLLGLILLAII